MELKKLLSEKKEAIATSPNTNMTLHYDPQFAEVGEDGKPEFSFSITMSSVGGKEEQKKLAEAVKLELRRALRKFDKNVSEVLEKYNAQAR